MDFLPDMGVIFGYAHALAPLVVAYGAYATPQSVDELRAAQKSTSSAGKVRLVGTRLMLLKVPSNLCYGELTFNHMFKGFFEIHLHNKSNAMIWCSKDTCVNIGITTLFLKGHLPNKALKFSFFNLIFLLAVNAKFEQP